MSRVSEHRHLEQDVKGDAIGHHAEHPDSGGILGRPSRTGLLLVRPVRDCRRIGAHGEEARFRLDQANCGQNDQICAAYLKIIKQPTVAQSGGSASAVPDLLRHSA
jgi:hypothetical protein